ncbi:MAG TPA: DUF1761 domain-containing protein [Candidatus Saccharimonadales bacterium]|nr:DUF1761 domain-containing protein [Candidatus Saccharimonadales bacterium]
MDVSIWAVIVAAAINMVVGYLWYSKALFAEAWSKAVGKKMEDMSGGGQGYALTTVGALVQAWILGLLVHWRGADSLWLGAKVGFLVWLGFVATTYATSYIFESRPKKLYYINVGYFLVVLVINGALLAIWPQ